MMAQHIEARVAVSVITINNYDIARSFVSKRIRTDSAGQAS